MRKKDEYKGRGRRTRDDKEKGLDRRMRVADEEDGRGRRTRKTDEEDEQDRIHKSVQNPKKIEYPSPLNPGETDAIRFTRTSKISGKLRNGCSELFSRALLQKRPKFGWSHDQRRNGCHNWHRDRRRYQKDKKEGRQSRTRRRTRKKNEKEGGERRTRKREPSNLRETETLHLTMNFQNLLTNGLGIK